MKTAADVMTRNLVTVAPATPVSSVSAMILENEITALPVVDDDGRLLGIVSEDDLVRAAEARRDIRRSWWRTLLDTRTSELKEMFGEGTRPVQEVMSRDVVVASEADPLRKLVVMLSRRRIKQLPIIKGEKLVGIVSRVDILRYLAKERTML